MPRFYVREQIEIPEPEGSDPKEVYAFYGLCAYWAQVLEQGIINLLVSLQIVGLTSLTNRDVEVLFERAGRKTLGQLISDVRKHVDVSETLELRLEKVLKERNFLTHHFFASHDVDFMSRRGSEKMIQELRDITVHFQQVDHQLEDLAHDLWHRIGLTAELFNQGLEQMKHVAARQDDDSA